MDKLTATRLIEALMQSQEALNRAINIAETIEVVEERNAYCLAIKEMIGHGVSDTILPIIRQYPELNPYK